jgi:hypothetical protein
MLISGFGNKPGRSAQRLSIRLLKLPAQRRIVAQALCIGPGRLRAMFASLA